MTANEKRNAVKKQYDILLGRNYYSQPRRDYCYRKYTDGKYYSDCSSSISYAYKEAGLGFGILNTVGMYQSTKMVDVDITIKNGIPQEVDRLRVGDILLFAGTSTSRAYADYVGHVEMVYAIDGTKVTLCGHGSGRPSLKDMKTYCTSRRNAKTSTKLGNKGLIRVRRIIQDDAAGGGTTTTPTPAPTVSGSTFGNTVTITGNTVNIRKGAGTEYAAFKIARKGDKFERLDTTGWLCIKYNGKCRWISAKYVNTAGDCTGGAVNVRSGAGTHFPSVGIVRCGDHLEAVQTAGWIPVVINKEVYWVSAKYAK